MRVVDRVLAKLARSTSKAARFALAGATGSLWHADRRAAAFGGDDGCLLCHRGMGDAYHLLYTCPCLQKERRQAELVTPPDGPLSVILVGKPATFLEPPGEPEVPVQVVRNIWTDGSAPRGSAELIF
eukprot:5092665-Amphidinium_carterae.1